MVPLVKENDTFKCQIRKENTLELISALDPVYREIDMPIYHFTTNQNIAFFSNERLWYGLSNWKNIGKSAVCLIIYLAKQQRNHRNFALLTLCDWKPPVTPQFSVDSPYEGSVMRKAFLPCELNIAFKLYGTDSLGQLIMELQCYSFNP